MLICDHGEYRANAAALALHGRWFGGRAITCAHTDPAAYNYQSLP